MDYLNVEPITADNEIGSIIHEKSSNDLCPSLVLLGEDRTCMPEFFLNYAERIKNFEVKSDNVWIASYPKTEKQLTEKQIESLTKHQSFESMKNNKAVNVETFVDTLRKSNMLIEDGAFMTSGVVGKYKEELSSETIKRFDEWIKKNVVGTSFEQEYDFDL